MRSNINPRYYYGFLNRLGVRMIEWAGWSNRLLRWLVYAFAAFLLWMCASAPLSFGWQVFYGVAVYLLALFIRRYTGTLVTLIMIGFSVNASLRYLYWRFTESLNMDAWLDIVFAYILIGAELYALLVLLLGYVQTIWPLRRTPLALPDDVSLWPTVDVYIPTYNEPLKVVKPTVYAALAMDWPKEKLNVYILDDGRREEFAEFAREAGAIHLTRGDNKHAKAGNINAALPRTHGEYIAFFDCDHIPTRAFLQMTMGQFLHDRKLALVQTPHHFLSPDPFERNLETFRKVPNEGELFYGVIQDGNDMWNAAFFCGSCAVIKRKPLEEVGGVAIETVTEDAHTSLKMQRRGYNTAYLSIPLAAGLATESLSAHVKQRMRWARGMAQIFRVDNPFLGRGLNMWQRMCYGNAIFHFFYGLPRLIFLMAPLSFLFFHAHIINADAITILAYALPHLAHATLTNSRIQSAHRHSFWAEVYEATLAWYIMRPTIRALFSSKTGSFDVTAKGGLVEKDYFDWSISRPYVVMFVLNLIGLIIGFFRLFWWNSYEAGTVLLNIAWTIYNLLILGAVLAVARESKQVRTTHRVPLKIKCALLRANGEQYECVTDDLSEGGVAVVLPEGVHIDPKELVQVAFLRGEWGSAFPARVLSLRSGILAMRFEGLTHEQESELVQLTLSRADAWLNWSEDRDLDRPMHGMAEIFKLGVKGMGRMFNAMKLAVTPGKRSAGSTAAMLALAACLVLGSNDSQAAHHRKAVIETTAAPAVAADQKQYDWSLQHLGVGLPLQLHGVDGEATIPFSIRSDEIVTGAKLTVTVAFSPALIPELSHLKVMLNDEVMATVPVVKGANPSQTVTIPLDARAFLDFNRLTFKLIAHYTRECEDPMHSTLWATVDNQSALQLTVSKMNQRNDLSLIPSPFFDKLDSSKLSLPFVFPGMPSAGTLQAAGTVASWFGSLASYRGVDFPVSTGSIPSGNAVVFLSANQGLPGIPAVQVGGATVAIMDNPGDARGKLLLVMGRDDNELQLAARALALGQAAFSGSSVQIGEIKDAPARRPYDAPNWIPSDRPVHFGELMQQEAMVAKGFAPEAIRVPVQFAPDLFWADARGVPVDLHYRYTPHPTTGKSSLNIEVNNRYSQSLPLRATTAETHWFEDFYHKLMGTRRTTTDSEGKAQVETEGFGSKPFDNRSISQEKIWLPTYMLMDRSQLQFRYYFEYDKQGFCRSGLIDNMRGAIDANSTIDVSSFAHYLALPNLSKFVNSGFPYTRMADLSETAVVMPDRIGTDDIRAYLIVMGKMGEATGYPANRMVLTTAAGVSNVADKDLIVIGSVGNQPLLNQWASELPLALSGNGQRNLQMPGVFKRLMARWDGRDLDAESRRVGLMTMRDSSPIGAMMQIQSPLSKGRAVVFVAAETPSLLPAVVEPMFDAKAIANFNGDLVLVDGNHSEGFLIGDSFYVGKLPLATSIRYFVGSLPWLMVVFIVIASLLVAAALFRVLRRKAKARLNK